MCSTSPLKRITEMCVLCVRLWGYLERHVWLTSWREFSSTLAVLLLVYHECKNPIWIQWKGGHNALLRSILCWFSPVCVCMYVCVRATFYGQLIANRIVKTSLLEKRLGWGFLWYQDTLCALDAPSKVKWCDILSRTAACPTCNDFHGLVQKIMELQDVLAKTSSKVQVLRFTLVKIKKNCTLLLWSSCICTQSWSFTEAFSLSDWMFVRACVRACVLCK